jgi:hypothetical protein
LSPGAANGSLILGIAATGLCQTKTEVALKFRFMKRFNIAFVWGPVSRIF